MSYTPRLTRSSVADIRSAWMAAGMPRVPAGSTFSIVVEAVIKRPESHTRKDGSPTTAWAEAPRRPDVDNVLKLVLDALQPHCFADDALCREAATAKRYGSENRIDVTISWP